MKIFSTVPYSRCASGRLASYPLVRAVLFILAFVLASSASEAVKAERWLPGFAPTVKEDTEPNRTKITLRAGETRVYRFDACEPVAGRIDIKESGDNTPKWFAITNVRGNTRATHSACGTANDPAVTGVVNFSTGGACDTSAPGPWYFSITGGKSFWWGVDNYLGRINCGEPVEPEPGKCPECPAVTLPTPTFELRFRNKAGQTALNTANGLPCKYVGLIDMIDYTRDPPRAWMTITGDLQVCEWPE